MNPPTPTLSARHHGAAVPGQGAVDRALLFRALATPVRLKIVGALLAGELPTAALTARTGASQANLSMHLAVLRRTGIVRRRRDRGGFCYHLSDNEAGQECRRLHGLMLAQAGGDARHE